MFLEVLLLRLLLWVGVPLLLVVLAIGPLRFWRSVTTFWSWLWMRRLDPERILTDVVNQHQEHIVALRQALSRLEAAEVDITRNINKSHENLTTLEEEAQVFVRRGDDLGARAALYKLNIERLAVRGFEEHLERQRRQITEARRRLYLLELQLRQYEVGRSILLSQLAEAQTVEQQYAIASNFDPFQTVANWQQAEGIVQEKTLSARAVEQVYTDLAEMPLVAQAAQVDPGQLDQQLAEMKANLAQAPGKTPDKTGRNGRTV
jgi:phage shock protein A